MKSWLVSHSIRKYQTIYLGPECQNAFIDLLGEKVRAQRALALRNLDCVVIVRHYIRSSMSGKFNGRKDVGKVISA